MDGVLDGVRIIDLSRFIAGPCASMLLADFGAEVIRVERSGGEEDRYIGLWAPSGDSLMFLNQARNKKAITLNYIYNKEALELFMRLIGKADVLLHNFSPTAVKRMGIDYETLSSINPGLIYAEVTAFGSRGAYANRLGFDPIAQALSGGTVLNGYEDHPPLRAGVPYVDYGTGFLTAFGIALALYHRDRTGKGQKIESSLLKTAVAMNALPISEYAVTGKKRTRIGNRGWYVGPSDLYKTKDGKWLYVTTVTKGLFARWCRLLGREELTERADLSTDYDRFHKRDEIDPMVEGWVLARTAEEAQSELTRARIPYSLAYDVDEVADDPQVKAEEVLIDLDHGEFGTFKLCGTPVSLLETPARVRLPGPRVGEHNEEIFCGLLGYPVQKLTEFQEKGVL